MATNVEFTKALLPEICDIKTGKHDANHATDNGKYRFYTCSSQYSMCDTYSFDGKAVIVPGNGDIGLVFYYDGLFEAYQRTYVLTNIKILPKYLYYHMLLYWRSFNERKKFGSTVKYVRMSNFSNYEITYPPIAEQERIVAKIEELFSQSDKAIQTLQTVKQQLSIYRQSVLKNAFEGKFTDQWRKNNAYNIEDILSEIKTKNLVVGFKPMLESYNLPVIPSEWKWVSIGDISTGAEYGSSKKSKKTGTVPVLRMGNIQNGQFVMDDLVYSDDPEEISKYQLKKSDVLFNRTNSSDLVGKTAAFTDDTTTIFAGYLIRVNQVPEIDYRYLTMYLNSQTAKGYGNKVKTDGVNQSNINSKKLYSYPFPLCSFEEQKEIIYILESRLSVCDSIEKTVDDALLQAEALRQSILKQAFEGELI